jgi:hypothetical protein
VTFQSGLAAAWLVAAFAGTAWLVAPATRRTNLGIVHPAVPFLALEAVFFGLGSVVLTLVDEVVGPAWFVGAAMLAFGLGVFASSEVAARRIRTAHASAGSGPGSDPALGPEGAPVAETGLRRLVPGLIAVAAVAAVGSVLVRSGIPFLTTDITGARGELVGIPVQLIRVALPALSVVWLLEWERTGAPRSSAMRAGGFRLAGISLLLAFTVLLASRYLAAELVAALAVAWILAGRRLPLRPTFAVLIAGIAAFVVIGVIRSYDRAQGQEVAFATERTVSRIVLVQPRTLDALQQAIPNEQPYFLGLTWFRRAGALFGRTDIPNLGYWIYPRVVQDAGSQATAGYAAPGLLGEAWANFGPMGVVLFALLGVVVERVGALLANLRTRIVDVATGALTILFVARTHALGLGGLAILLGLVVGWRLLAGEVRGIAADLRDTALYRSETG